MTDPLLKPEDVAEILGVPASWVRKAARENRIPVVRIGKYLRFNRDSILEWAREQEAKVVS